MFSFFKKKPAGLAAAPEQSPSPDTAAPVTMNSIALRADSMPGTAPNGSENALLAAEMPRKSWMDKLKHGLRKTGSS
ncbi:MAG: signal recognition particle-docking protein FtsY, partial [Brachymonas sp.]